MQLCLGLANGPCLVIFRINLSSQRQEGLKFDFNLILLHYHSFSSLELNFFLSTQGEKISFDLQAVSSSSTGFLSDFGQIS